MEFSGQWDHAGLPTQGPRSGCSRPAQPSLYRHVRGTVSKFNWNFQKWTYSASEDLNLLIIFRYVFNIISFMTNVFQSSWEREDGQPADPRTLAHDARGSGIVSNSRHSRWQSVFYQVKKCKKVFISPLVLQGVFLIAQVSFLNNFSLIWSIKMRLHSRIVKYLPFLKKEAFENSFTQSWVMDDFRRAKFHIHFWMFAFVNFFFNW